ncbi:MAG: PASTA domain-containing protein [Deltaproteobacteria bacterium]|nr:PASTA domain-containing protein [Deltaproteobacteria bacterium]
MNARKKRDRGRLPSWKIFFLVFLLAGGAGGLLVRAYYLQVVRHDFFLSKFSRQNRLAVEIRPERGEILDVNGNKLAISLETQSIYVQPHRVKNKKRAARRLARALGLPYRRVYRRLTSKKYFQWLKRDVLPKQVAAVRRAKIKGVGFISERRRFYPNRELAGQLLGFVGVDSRGLEGLELQYDRYLRGRKNVIFLDRDARRRMLDLSGKASPVNIRGKTVVLTIDRNIQHVVDQELARAVTGSRAKRGLALVLDVNSGAIRAMSQYPFFNPNSFTSSSSRVWRNRAVVDLIEPGSTFKVFTVAAALEKGVVKPGDRFYCEEGEYRVGRRTIHDTHEYDELTVAEIIKYSSNIGCSKVAARLGRQSFYRFLRRCGFGEPTGVDFPGEKAGILRDWRRWRDIDFCNISFGQGVAVTPLQLAAAYAALANGGHRVRPYLVEKVVDGSGWEVYRHQHASPGERVLSPRVARQVLAMLQKVVEDDGTAPAARIPGYQVAGKTGTAQKYDFQQKKYSRSNYLASFIGFIPGDRVRGSMLIYVLVDEPRTSIYGGVVAAPAFRHIGQRVLAYLNVEPSSRIQVAGAAGEREPVVKKGCKVINRAVQVKNQLAKNIMPDFAGRSVREVFSYFGTLPGPVVIHGSGRITRQKPGPGQQLLAGNRLEFYLSAEN